MDPLSLTASLVAVLTAAQLGVNGLRKLNNYRNAPQEMDLISELESLEALFKDVQAFAELHWHALLRGSLFECLQRAALKIHNIHQLLTSKPFNIPRLNKASQALLVWARYKPRFIALRDDLRVIKADLVLRLSLASASLSFDLRDALDISIGARDRPSNRLEIIAESISAPGQPTQPASELSDLLLSSSSSYDIATSGLPSDPTSPSSILALAYPSAELPELKELHPYRSPAPIRSNPMTGRRTNRCAVGCGCICHTRSRFRSPWMLKTLLGEINIHYSGRRPDCNEFNCRRDVGSSIIMVYQLPNYLMSRYVSMTMRYASLDGPPFSLRVPRVMRWSHLLWNYANNDDLLAVQKMFSDGTASPHDLNLHGTNALIYTVAHNNLGLTKFLLDQKADPNLPNGAGITAAELLWERAFAGRFGDEGICKLELLLKDSDYFDDRGFTTLHKIVLGLNHKDLKSELETSTAALNIFDSRGRTPLCWAAIRNEEGAVRTLLDYKSNPNILDNLGHTPLDFVQSVAICRLLLDAGVDKNARKATYGRSALHHFCQRGVCRTLHDNTIGVIDMLIHAGFDVNVRNADGETPLLNAIFSGLTHHARRLIELGADVNIANYSSRDSAIIFAVSFNHHEILPFLLEMGADYKHVGLHRRTIAHVAAQSADAKMMRILTESNLVNLDVNLHDMDGKPPADYLAERSILVEGEEGLHREFEKLLRSLPPQSLDISALATDHVDLEFGLETKDHCHLPDAYPRLSNLA